MDQSLIPQNNQPQDIPPYQQTAPVVSISEWIIALIIMMIPIVNIIMMFVWAFRSKTNPNKANYFKAQLLTTALVFVLVFTIAIFK